MTLPPHPGFIVYLEAPSMREVRRLPVTQVPDELRFAQTPEGWVPVVKVVAQTDGDRRTLSEFGPDDQLLRTTTQRREP